MTTPNRRAASMQTLALENSQLRDANAALRELLRAIAELARMPLPVEEDWPEYRMEAGIRLHDIANWTPELEVFPVIMRGRAEMLRSITARGFIYRPHSGVMPKPAVDVPDDEEHQDQAAADVAAAVLAEPLAQLGALKKALAGEGEQ